MSAGDFFAYVYLASGAIALAWFVALGLNALGLSHIIMWPSILISSAGVMIASKIAARHFYRKAH